MSLEVQKFNCPTCGMPHEIPSMWLASSIVCSRCLSTIDLTHLSPPAESDGAPPAATDRVPAAPVDADLPAPPARRRTRRATAAAGPAPDSAAGAPDIAGPAAAPAAPEPAAPAGRRRRSRATSPGDAGDLIPGPPAAAEEGAGLAGARGGAEAAALVDPPLAAAPGSALPGAVSSAELGPLPPWLAPAGAPGPAPVAEPAPPVADPPAPPPNVLYTFPPETSTPLQPASVLLTPSAPLGAAGESGVHYRPGGESHPMTLAPRATRPPPAPVGIALVVGMEGAFGGESYRVAGRMRYRDGYELWDEWLLRSATGEERWLSDRETQRMILWVPFNPGEEVDPGRLDVGMVVRLGTPLVRVQTRGTAVVEYLEGECTWQVETGSQVDYVDAIGSGGQYRIQWTADEMEFALGRRPHRPEVERAFGVQSAPEEATASYKVYHSDNRVVVSSAPPAAPDRRHGPAIEPLPHAALPVAPGGARASGGFRLRQVIIILVIVLLLLRIITLFVNLDFLFHR
ncbi:MAG TPA: DUF4178 domain-containing protein [Chloroflexia bacterium]|nr:DUF4178 domain-containing protein [Chloroflexia bacterium]